MQCIANKDSSKNFSEHGLNYKLKYIKIVRMSQLHAYTLCQLLSHIYTLLDEHRKALTLLPHK